MTPEDEHRTRTALRRPFDLSERAVWPAVMGIYGRLIDDWRTVLNVELVPGVFRGRPLWHLSASPHLGDREPSPPLRLWPYGKMVEAMEWMKDYFTAMAIGAGDLWIWHNFERDANCVNAARQLADSELRYLGGGFRGRAYASVNDDHMWKPGEVTYWERFPMEAANG